MNEDQVNQPSFEAETQATWQRIAQYLGVQGSATAHGEQESLLKLAAERLEKANRLMQDMERLKSVAVRHGFSGTSAGQLLAFAGSMIAEQADSVGKPAAATKDDKDAWLPRLEASCAKLQAASGMHEAKPTAGPIGVHACFVILGQAANGLEAQRATIGVLTDKIRLGAAFSAEVEDAMVATRRAHPKRP